MTEPFCWLLNCLASDKTIIAACIVPALVKVSAIRFSEPPVSTRPRLVASAALIARALSPCNVPLLAMLLVFRAS
ncbi:hypothetical protein D3C80_1499810 [compost metagenome]